MVPDSSYLARALADFEKLLFYHENRGIYHFLSTFSNKNYNPAIFHLIYLIINENLYSLTPFTNI